MITTRIAKFVMKLSERYPVSPEKEIGELQEVFCHNSFINGSESQRNEIMLKCSKNKYHSEIEYPWDNYFGKDLRPFLENKEVLDLGCLVGGRGVAWYERYKLKKITGIDVSDDYINASKQLAKKRSINADYKLAKGESLPFEDECFDAVLTFDVLEHVQNLGQTLAECLRVLKPGGKMFLVFPGYFQPVEHHLSLVTRIPFIQYFFSGETLVKAYCEIIEERGEETYWYKRSSSDLMSWEKGNTINGTTLSKFLKLLENSGWTINYQSRKPIGSIGRNISKNKVLKIFSKFIYPLVYVPGLREIFLHRITFVLEKPQ